MKNKYGNQAKLGLKGILIIILIVVSIGASSLIVWYSVRNKPIRINRNVDFKLKYNFPGSGTKEDPYRIENLQITVKDHIGIGITNTSKHFIIQNCNIISDSHCILLADVGNGTAIVRYNTLSQISEPYSMAVLINKAPYCIFSNNTFTGNIREGCSVSYSSYSIVANNSFNHVLLPGILVYNLQNITVMSNEITTISSIKTNYSSAIRLTRVNYGKVLNNSISGLFDYGIKVKECTSIDILYNNVNKTGYSSAYIFDSELCSIANNVFENSVSFGLVLNNTKNITIKSNIFRLNGNYAILLNSSSYNLAYHNSFIDNNLAHIFGQWQAFDDGTENNWYNSLLLEGNYWSDLDWNTTATYLIDGGSNVDNYPLETPLISLFLFRI